MDGNWFSLRYLLRMCKFPWKCGDNLDGQWFWEGVLAECGNSSDVLWTLRGIGCLLVGRDVDFGDYRYLVGGHC